MVRGAIQSILWPAIAPLERLTVWKAAGLVLAGLAAGFALRMTFEQWMHGHTLFMAFLPAILVVTLRGGLLTGAATLFFSKSLALAGLTESASSTPRLLLWAVAGGITVLAAYGVRDLVRAERACRMKVLEREARTMKLIGDFEAAAKRAAREQGDAEAARLAATLSLLRRSIESPAQLDAVVRLAAE